MNYTGEDVYKYISQQTNDPIVERKICVVSGQPFPVYKSDLDFYKKMSPEFDGQTYDIPAPTLCPEERHRRRLLRRNERKLYRRKCDASGKSIVTVYSPDKDMTVYDHKLWWSDHRDPLDYGVDFDFTKTFSQQFESLMRKVPTMSLYVTPDAEENNCIYVNAAGLNKNCYLIFDSDENQDCMYSNVLKHSHDCYDCSYDTMCTQGYELFYCGNCTNCIYSHYCTGCSNCSYCLSCVGCSFCVGCTGLYNKQYCIRNIQYSKEEYEAILEKGYTQGYLPREILAGVHNNIQSCENVFGSALMQSKNLTFCNGCFGVQDSKYTDGVLNAGHDLWDHSSFGEDAKYCIECEGTGRNVSNVFFSKHVFMNASDVRYSYQCCQNVHHLFGCVGIRNREYCVFNKQYTKEAYEELVPRIIAHMQETGERGEFLNSSSSPFDYNETVAYEYYPMTREAAIARGYKRLDLGYDPAIPEGSVTLQRGFFTAEQWNDLKETDDVLQQIIICETSGRPFRLQKAELIFYRKHNLPIPSKHPDVRHTERMAQAPGLILYLRKCDKGGEPMVSVYPPSHPVKVYCEDDYAIAMGA